MVAVVGSDPIQLKYSEDMTKKLIKYVLLDIQPKISFKHIDVSSLHILEGVLRIVPIVDEEDTDNIKDRDGVHIVVFRQNLVSKRVGSN
jgi:hypothetical protein